MRDRGSCDDLRTATAALPTTASSSCGRRAAGVARTAAEACGSLSVEEALRSVTMPAASVRRASEALVALGFDTALDLELLGGGDAAVELLAELKAGGLGPADRAKVKLLVGDREHLWRLQATSTTSRVEVLAADHDYRAFHGDDTNGGESQRTDTAGRSSSAPAGRASAGAASVGDAHCRAGETAGAPDDDSAD